MTRKDAREFAMQTLFQMDVQKNFDVEAVGTYLAEKDLYDQKEYVKALLTNICDKLDLIDEEINNNSKGWPASRIAKTDLAIIRLAIGEIKFMENVPNAVAINEAVNLAKIYGTERSAGFVNAVLGKVVGV